MATRLALLIPQKKQQHQSIMARFKTIHEKISRFKNRWIHLPFIIILAFFVMLFFFGDYNFINRKEYINKISAIKAEIKANEDSAAVYEAKSRELDTDRQTLERIAREKYGMKRTNEDVYITDIP